MAENLTGQEAVGASETRRLIDAAANLMPELSPHVFDLSDLFDDDPEAISVVLMAAAAYNVEQTLVTLETEDASGSPTLRINVRTPDMSGEGYEDESYFIFIDTLEVSCSKYAGGAEGPESLFDVQLDEVSALVEKALDKLKFNEMVGDDLLTQDRYDKLMHILAKCNPDNLVDSA